MALILLSIAAPLLAGEGKALDEKSCTRCHDTEVFIDFKGCSLEKF